MATSQEYLVSYGVAGLLGRFVTESGQSFTRGDRVLVQSDRGLEAGTVVLHGNGTTLALPFLPVPGQLLRALNATDLDRFTQAASQGKEAFALARALTEEQGLPVEIVDVETITEPLTFVLHHLRFGSVDWRPVVSQLSTSLNAYVLLHDITAPQETSGCGSCGEGGCGEGGCSDRGCGTGGCGSGCGTGSQEDFAQDWEAYFADRRQEMERRRISLPL